MLALTVHFANKIKVTYL